MILFYYYYFFRVPQTRGVWFPYQGPVSANALGQTHGTGKHLISKFKWLPTLLRYYHIRKANLHLESAWICNNKDPFDYCVFLEIWTSDSIYSILKSSFFFWECIIKKCRWMNTEKYLHICGRIVKKVNSKQVYY